jgi:iron complex outermembrane receptor protein
MIEGNPLFLIRSAMLTLVFIAGMAGTGEGGPPSFDENRSEKHGVETAKTPFVEDAVDRGTPQLVLTSAGEEDRQELQQLLAILEEETAFVTKTKMNNDYVPGMVTVLHGEQLEAQGVKTVAEALAMVPGIQVARLSTGEPTVKVRGIAFPFNAGNIKVMLNSIALSRESSGINSSVLLTPLAQVDRIEVIRGPGSSIYGDFAMAGVVNIITKDAGGRLFGQAGDDESRGGGGHYSYRNAASDFSLGVNISAMDDGENAADLIRDPDEQRYTGVFSFNYKKFSLTAEGVRRRVESKRQFPPGAFPPPPIAGSDRSFREEESWAMEGLQSVELGSKAVLDLSLSYLQNTYDADEPMDTFEGDRLETRLDLNWSPWSGHQVLIGVSYTDSNIDDATQEGPAGTSPVRLSDVGRHNYSLSLQDQVALNERISLTFGARFDHYDDVGGLMTPRIAAVYRMGEHHVVKAQYSEGFRAPTFWELYGTGTADEGLDFEVMDTTELSYIYRRPNFVGRLTLYYSEIEDGIFQKSGGGYGNIVEIDSKGAELEWEQKLGEMLRWQANLSYNDTWDGRSTAGGHESPGVASWLGNLALLVQPAAKLVLAGRLLHVGDRYTTDGRVAGYNTLDLSISRMDLWKAGLTLRVGVKNAFDDTIVYLTQRPDGLFEEEFRGRTWWLQLSYDY